jgi:hypothetical protein
MASRYSVKDMSLVSLKYPGKLSREEIYRTVSPAKLVIVKEFMIAQPLIDDGWLNMVIRGDNLEVLRALIEDSRVKGKARLVNIDPPFDNLRVYEWGLGYVRLSKT